MNIVLAKKIGFCFGVKRAVDIAEEELKKNRSIYSLGYIIHNEQVVDSLSKKGLKVARDVKGIRKGACIISSHGISPKVFKELVRRGIRVIDTTCPFVLKAQRIAESLSRARYNVIIVGDADHPEVRALVDFVSTDVFVVRDAGEARRLRLKKEERYIVISQTTQTPDNFRKVVKVISLKPCRESKVFNTICKDAEDRQKAARRLAGSVDTMLVIGGKRSANTKRLFEVCRTALDNSHLIQTEDDLKRIWFDRLGSVGITSGASTPDWVVKRVVKRIKILIQRELPACKGGGNP